MLFFTALRRKCNFQLASFSTTGSRQQWRHVHVPHTGWGETGFLTSLLGGRGFLSESQRVNVWTVSLIATPVIGARFESSDTEFIELAPVHSEGDPHRSQVSR
jgi:hypothetical protein